MTNLLDRFNEWMTEHDRPDAPATAAATVLVLRDGDDGLEVLMVQRNATGSFAGNWVFPGGKVDAEDFRGTEDADDIVEASRRAAAREALEETDLVVAVDELVAFSHWMPPSVVARRFATWFFVTAAREGVDSDITIDGGEIVDHLWVSPAEALRRQSAGQVDLVPPTWVTLHHLSEYGTATDAVEATRARKPRFYVTRRLDSEILTVAWHGDAGYESGVASTEGSRHRLEMNPDGWKFVEPTTSTADWARGPG